MTARRVAVMGTAPSSVQLAPYADPEWEIWGTSRLYEGIPRWTRWFELHDLDTIGKGWQCSEDERRARRAAHVGWMAEQMAPIYLQHEDERVPAGIAYPLDAVLAYLAECGATERYLTNSVSYMLALAIYEGVDEIGVYGVDMALTEEWGYQRPSCEYLIGLARGLGIKVTIPKESDLLKTVFLYGYEDNSEFSAKARARGRELKARLESEKESRDGLRMQRQQLIGRLGVVEELLAQDVDPELRAQLEAHATEVAAQAKVIEGKVIEAAQNIAGFHGAIDNHTYLSRSWGIEA